MEVRRQLTEVNLDVLKAKDTTSTRTSSNMSSQDNKGIPFSHALDGVGYKLLELPPELVTLLEGENPPTLKLKSSPTAGLLEAAGKTYSLRQKNTSNALIILRPEEEAVATTELSVDPAQESKEVPPSSGMPEVGMRAFASVHETVELLPEAGSVPSAATSAKGKWHEKFGKTR
ncbi:hypothetical protein GGTG_03074 [Gaeumannomyces tritici R3-111a-1]|uniref:Sister chromatid cohesion protein DCC1 n=1 Tax=Gaeumannomyces tritici (strain R3-111a-1) TaxID=644352 RepID=J3NP68_GAET3|nr:hypothetical protein GGTG_03074 [Gaeumannomyces tritici R3-111a-1]EJT77971.1 hypothetical protein GGTG_03074 [Gaeumannomyces tritici R3-111a-1]